jgi:hypothetical protein
VSDLLSRALAAGWEDNYVAAPDWGMSTASGTGIDGVILHVYRSPVRYPAAPVEYCPECHGRAFPLTPEDKARGWPLDGPRERAMAVAAAHGHVTRFSTTERGQRSMRQAIARAAGDPNYWRVQ